MKFCVQPVGVLSERIRRSLLRLAITEKLRSIASHSKLWLGSKTSFDAAQTDYRDDHYSGRMTKKKIAYFYDAEVGNFYYGQVRGTNKKYFWKPRLAEGFGWSLFTADTINPYVLSAGTPDETTSHEDDSQLTFALRTSFAHGGKFVLFYLEVRIVNTGRHRSINRHRPVLKNWRCFTVMTTSNF